MVIRENAIDTVDFFERDYDLRDTENHIKAAMQKHIGMLKMRIALRSIALGRGISRDIVTDMVAHTILVKGVL